MVTAITNSNMAAAAAASAKTSSRNQLGEKDFLRLLTTQLKQQDPTSPVDNKEMIAQMAQFSSLSGITEMNSTLKSISAKLDAVLARPAAASAATLPATIAPPAITAA